MRSLATKIHKGLPSRFELDDLVAYGQVGLAEAARDFDASRGIRFSTYAYYRIRGAIYDGLSKMTWLSRAQYERLRYEQMANETLQAESEEGGTSVGESAEEGMRWLRDIAGVLAMVYLATQSDDEEDSGPGDVEDAAAASPASVAIDRELREKLHELVDALPLEATVAGRSEARFELDRFLDESSPGKALARWIEWTMPRGAVLDKRQIEQRLNRDVAQLDALLNARVNAIIHHPRFQKLDASWRGLRYLSEQLEGDENVKIRVLSAAWKELARDAERAIEFDQSQLFRKVCGEEFDTPGGEPFGVLLGDFSGLAQPMNLAAAFQQADHFQWRNFRQQEDSRFVGLTLPRVLMRLPYEDDGSRVDPVDFGTETMIVAISLGRDEATSRDAVSWPSCSVLPGTSSGPICNSTRPSGCGPR